MMIVICLTCSPERFFVLPERFLHFISPRLGVKRLKSWFQGSESFCRSILGLGSTVQNYFSPPPLSSQQSRDIVMLYWHAILLPTAYFTLRGSHWRATFMLECGWCDSPATFISPERFFFLPERFLHFISPKLSVKLLESLSRGIGVYFGVF